MLVYLGLLLLILFLTLICNQFIKDTKLKNKIITATALLIIYLLYVLRDYAVGTDTDAYFATYEQMKNVPFKDFDTIYMEKGYQFLMKICILAKMDFRLFLCVGYAIAVVPLYFFITKFSKNVSLSIIFYICYQFLSFSMSGVRQTIALGICILSYLVLESKIKWKYLWFFLLVTAGFYIHKSALVFIFVPLVRKIPLNKTSLVSFVVMFLVAFAFKDKISNFLAGYTGYAGTFTLGLNYMFVLFLIILSIMAIWYTNNINEKPQNLEMAKWLKMSCYALLLHTTLYTTVLLRAASLLTIFFILLVPRIIEMFNEKTKKILIPLIHLVLILFFFITTLATNQLEITHYKFFWQ